LLAFASPKARRPWVGPCTFFWPSPARAPELLAAVHEPERRPGLSVPKVGIGNRDGRPWSASFWMKMTGSRPGLACPKLEAELLDVGVTRPCLMVERGPAGMPTLLSWGPPIEAVVNPPARDAGF